MKSRLKIEEKGWTRHRLTRKKRGGKKSFLSVKHYFPFSLAFLSPTKLRRSESSKYLKTHTLQKRKHRRCFCIAIGSDFALTQSNWHWDMYCTTKHINYCTFFLAGSLKGEISLHFLLWSFITAKTQYLWAALPQSLKSVICHRTKKEKKKKKKEPTRFGRPEETFLFFKLPLLWQRDGFHAGKCPPIPEKIKHSGLCHRFSSFSVCACVCAAELYISVTFQTKEQDNLLWKEEPATQSTLFFYDVFYRRNRVIFPFFWAAGDTKRAWRAVGVVRPAMTTVLYVRESHSCHVSVCVTVLPLLSEMVIDFFFILLTCYLSLFVCSENLSGCLPFGEDLNVFSTESLFFLFHRISWISENDALPVFNSVSFNATVQ